MNGTERFLLIRPVVVYAWAWVIGYAAAVKLPLGQLNPERTFIAAAALLAALIVFRLPWRHAAYVIPLALTACCYYQWTDRLNVSELLPDNAAIDFNEGLPVQMRGRIASVVSIDGDKVSFVLNVSGILTEGEEAEWAVSEKVQITVRLLERDEVAMANAWGRGDDVMLSGELKLPSSARNFGGFDYRNYLRTQRIHTIVSIKGTEQVHVTGSKAMDWLAVLRMNDRIRSGLGETAGRLFPGEQGGYMKSLLIGLRVDMDPYEFQQFSRLGLTHLLAISGLHVAVFVAVILWIARAAGVTRETGLLIALWLIPFYVLLTGGSPSVIRAGLMAMLALYAARRQWLKDGLHLVCIVGWGMLVLNPYYLVDVGFQLSFLVTLGLIAAVPPVSSLLPFRSSMVNSTVAVTIVSQAVSFPLSVYYFNQFSLVSWIANMALVPLVSFVVTPLGSAALLAGELSIAVGKWLAWPVVKLNGITSWVVDLLDRFTLFHLIWPTPSLGWIAGWYGSAGLLLAALIRRGRAQKLLHANLLLDNPQGWRHKAAIPFYALLSALLLIYGYSPDRLERTGIVSFLDVGQGDAIWIHTPDDRNVLIDGGGTVTFRKKGEEWKERAEPFDVGNKLLVPLLKKRGVHRIDTLIITHLDADHIGGLQAVLEQIPVKQMVYNGTYKRGAGTAKLFQTALDKQIPLMSANRGDRLQLDGNTDIQFLYPAATSETEVIEESKQNNVSLVFMLKMNGFRFLMTGDMEKPEEEELLMLEREDETVPLAASKDAQLEDGDASKVDVLKVAHHGSKTSTTEEWLSLWKPSIAVISVGVSNIYRHPAAEVVDRIASHEAKLFRTDKNGEVQMRMKGDVLQVMTMLKEH
ncbi:DNA internalization-related competence protein ComEC/Rec2 [Paenibacillus sp. MBLB4367]|uniref:DNA internalization-related competence protein ComEC/Rec2 n=1 Tax=Paenibacillus sp. MBLB4367 TaxID=3384767 RepID=UPI0039080F5E